MKRMLMIGVAALIATNVGLAHASITNVSYSSGGAISYDLGTDMTWSGSSASTPSSGGTLSVNLTAQPTSNQVYFVGFTGGYQVSIVGTGISYFGFTNPETPAGDQGSNPTIAAVPVPGAFLLGALGLAAIAARKRR